MGGLINTLFKNIYIIIIAKTHSVVLAGYYQFSFNLISQTSTTFTNAITGVAFPSFSRIQNDAVLLVRSLEKLIMLVISVFLPLYVGLIVFSEPIFDSLFGEKWIEALPYFNSLCIIGVLIPLNAITSDIANVMGRSDVYFHWILIKKTITLVCLLFLYNSDILTLVYLRVFDGVCALIINLFVVATFLKLNWSLLFRNFGVVIITTIVATIMAKRLMLYSLESANSLLLWLAILSYIAVWMVGFSITHKGFVGEVIRKFI